MDLEENHDEFADEENFSAPEDLFDDEDENENGDILKHQNDDVHDEKRVELKPKPLKRKIVKNPRLILNIDRLKSENGIPALIEIFEKFKFMGKHHEKEDLTAIMQHMQHWMCNVLYPGYDMETCMKALEKLGRKRVFQTYMKRLRNESKNIAIETKEGSTVINAATTSCYELMNDDFNEIIV